MPTTASTIAAQSIITTRKAQAIGAKNIGDSTVYGSKDHTFYFMSHPHGAPIMRTAIDNTVQGQIVGHNAQSLSVSGQGGLVIKKTDGTLSLTRNGFSEGLNKGGFYVLGSEGDPMAPCLQGWATDESGIAVDRTGRPLRDATDKTKSQSFDLVDIHLGTDQTTYHKASQKITLNNILNSSQGTTPADTTTQNITFFDALGETHMLTLNWAKTGTGTGTSSTGITNCDTWTVTPTVPGTPLAFNIPQLYVKDGAIVELKNSIGATIQALPAVTVPFTNGQGNVVLDLGIETDPTTGKSKGRSVIHALATNAEYSGIADGSEVVDMTDWYVNEKGQFVALYPTTSKILYQLAVGIVPSPNAVLNRDGYWRETEGSGAIQFYAPGDGPAGRINPGTVEQSTIDPSEELTKLLGLQEVTMASSRIISLNQKSIDEIARVIT